MPSAVCWKCRRLALWAPDAAADQGLFRERMMRALPENGIKVTALHNHMLADQPRLFFMHFRAHGDAGKLVKRLRAALDQVRVAKG